VSFKLPLIAALAATALCQSNPAYCATPRQAADEASVARGMRLAERNCAQCHAIGATGQSSNPASPPFRELHRRYPANSLQEAFERGLLTKHPSMPQLRLTPGELVDLTAYFKALRSKDETEASIAAPAPIRLARR
jgi:cytochrome c